MSKDNPYKPPMETPATNVDPELTRNIASLIANSRDNPPTITSTLLKWPGTPKTALIGAICIPLLFLISGGSNAIPAYIPFVFAGMILGAILRDFGYARRTKHFWPAQQQFIDWDKVDQFSE